MIQTGEQRDCTKQIKADTTTTPASHVPMLSRPADVANVIIAAAMATSASEGRNRSKANASGTCRLPSLPLSCDGKQSSPTSGGAAQAAASTPQEAA